MKEILLLKDGEIVLKGLNRRSFEDVLKKNLKHALKSAGHFEITSAQSTIYVKPLDDDADLEKACEIVSRVFGIIAEPPFVKKQSNPFLKPLRNILKISLKI
mgnify:CR=1 FL=1